MARSVWGDHERFVKTYFSSFPGYYFTGDGARRDDDNYYWMTGRVDDLMNVSGKDFVAGLYSKNFEGGEQRRLGWHFGPSDHFREFLKQKLSFLGLGFARFSCGICLCQFLGHLLSTAEIESALVLHPDVVEAAVVAAPHPIKGQCPYAFVSLVNVGFNNCQTAIITKVTYCHKASNFQKKGSSFFYRAKNYRKTLLAN